LIRIVRFFLAIAPVEYRWVLKMEVFTFS